MAAEPPGDADFHAQAAVGRDGAGFGGGNHQTRLPFGECQHYGGIAAQQRYLVERGIHQQGQQAAVLLTLDAGADGGKQDIADGLADVLDQRQ